MLLSAAAPSLAPLCRFRLPPALPAPVHALILAALLASETADAGVLGKYAAMFGRRWLYTWRVAMDTSATGRVPPGWLGLAPAPAADVALLRLLGMKYEPMPLLLAALCLGGDVCVEGFSCN